ncbi:MAG: copper-binding protein [Acidobacteria bacterium]|nr:copper-binding protein [Acidobacteriota bacterium]
MKRELLVRMRGCWSRGAVAVLVALSAAAGVAGCSEKPVQQAASASAAVRYEMKGKVVSVDRQKKQLTIDHEDIPGFMASMSMAYPVRDARELDGVSAGDAVTATLVSQNGLYWLEKVTVTKKNVAP